MKLNATARIKAAKLEEKDAEQIIKKVFPKAYVATVSRTNGGCQGLIDTRAKDLAYGQLETLVEQGLRLLAVKIENGNIHVEFIAA